MRTGGPEGNARLTALTGVALLVLLAIDGFTLLSLRAMLSWHIFVGLLVVPVVALKLGSTGYKIYRYYSRRPDYVEAGPPHLLLRLLGPVVAVSTAALLATGIVLIVEKPGAGLMLLLHKASFVVWVGALGVHVLARLGRLPGVLRSDLGGRPEMVAGSRVRLLVVAGAVVIGAIGAVALLPQNAAWVHWLQFEH
jgi:hypothetical protein